MNPNTPPVAAPEITVESFTRAFLRELNFGQGVDLDRASANDKYLALSRAVRHYLTTRWLETLRNQYRDQAKVVAYLSAEFLLGPQLENALLASKLDEVARESLANLGLDLDEIRAVEVEPGLGNGGLGRLAACFIDSLATLNVPSIGYGIRYEYGIFKQTFVDGKQVETPDNWLRLGSPWEIPHPENAVEVTFGGRTEAVEGADGARRWIPDWRVTALPYNYMVPGYHNGRVNTLRLWSAKATHEFDLQIFNAGDYAEAVRARTFAENISKVLYPEDSTPQGKELRLQQQYFFVAASLRDFLENVLPDGYDLTKLPDRITWQLNDTHPVIAVPELMRLLIDEKGWTWDDAWAVTQKCFAYTCHTLLPEALEVWSVDLLGRLLPRHLEIIYRINEEFLEVVREAYPGDELRVRRMSIVAEQPERAIRMAHLATVAGFKVNGVAELHSQLLAEKVLHDFAELWPEKFTNVTNGVTPRRFVRMANPGLSGLITEAIGDGWVTDLSQLSRLEPLAEDPEFRRRFREVKGANKRRLAEVLAARDGLEIAGDAMVDAMVKRLHEYKRQSLKLLHIVSMYEGVKSGRTPLESITPRTFVFGAKAAPGYVRAKETIALINAVGRTINEDASLEGRLKVVFPPNYNVTLAEVLIPAADLSEQISLAGKEASGTGNMKFALNGALTIGTDDGANVEIRQLVGDDNFFLFGMTEPEAADLQAKGYDPGAYYESDPELKAALDLLASGAFTGGDKGGAVASLFASLTERDRFMALADFRSYVDAQATVEEAYQDHEEWSRKAILNVARTGFFSSDRSIQDYLDRIWRAEPVTQNH
ncbi:glycogen/starch/alpha-glucan phosphorylase [Demequina sp. SYSU T00039]|uniref:Alpha-1,4 glucan phosphorylase n=1 Tax=Demequina lignilytica TaxID=3051663 RepID=A0AAW7M656_9MICO|nr:MULTISPECIES: glycogen/starch/alpha-glucan phosphorylase [unclassified Demequina]MDN4477757.1 glycogen/starch/alpha-glucan phosphorylase [Demequina sp. SYSU T00039-1]MDN4487666.1 glycogen/starch/alpha-glucan phosphorylase [Demequina sp. SYSU T00039]MDN4491377.1 glycogen/starch/alpha-glucan phosphorylase [Demequina sp. SYSU T00068]